MSNKTRISNPSALSSSLSLKWSAPRRGVSVLSWITGLALGAAALVQTAQGAALEAFEYSAGSTMAWKNGGQGWAGPWGAQTGNGTIMMEDGSLAYPGIVSSGGKMRFIGVAGGVGTTSAVYRTNAVTLTNGVYYMRFLAQNLNEGRRYFGLGFFDGSSERALLGQGSLFSTWTFNHVVVAGTNTLISTVDSSAPALLVLKLELQDGPERVTFWVNPDLFRPENPAAAVGGGSFLTDNDFVKITRVRLGGGGYSATVGGDPTDHYMDEISISTVSPFLPPPAVAWGLSGGTLALSWPAEYLGWVLQTQVAGSGQGVGASWAGVDVPGTGGVLSTNLPVNPGVPAAFFRLRAP